MSLHFLVSTWMNISVGATSLEGYIINGLPNYVTYYRNPGKICGLKVSTFGQSEIRLKREPVMGKKAGLRRYCIE